MTGKAEREHPAFQYGKDSEFLEWISYQPSCLDGAFNQWLDDVPRNIPCHVRRARHSGTSFKPPFSAVPMTDDQHKMQSGKPGEVGVIYRYRGELLSPLAAKRWFDEQVEIHLQRWINHRKRMK